MRNGSKNRFLATLALAAAVVFSSGVASAGDREPDPIEYTYSWAEKVGDGIHYFDTTLVFDGDDKLPSYEEGEATAKGIAGWVKVAVELWDRLRGVVGGGKVCYSTTTTANPDGTITTKTTPVACPA